GKWPKPRRNFEARSGQPGPTRRLFRGHLPTFPSTINPANTRERCHLIVAWRAGLREEVQRHPIRSAPPDTCRTVSCSWKRSTRKQFALRSAFGCEDVTCGGL